MTAARPFTPEVRHEQIDDALRIAEGQLWFHVAAERRRKGKVRIAVLSWVNDLGTATWEAEMPDEGAPAPAAEGRE